MHFLSNKLKAYTFYLLFSGISAFATCCIFSINMVYQIETVKLSPLQLVLVGTTLESACFLCQVPTGVLADLYSRRMAVVVGVFLTGLGFLIEGLFPNFTVVLLAQIIWGVGATFTSGAEEAWVADEIGEADMARAFMRGSQISQVASLLAIPVGIGLATIRLSLAVVVGACILLVLSLFMLLFMPEQHFHPTPRGERTSWQAMGKMMRDGTLAVKRSPMLLLILAITACWAMSSEGFDRLQMDHLIQDFAFPALGHLSSLAWFGIINAGGMLLSLGGSELVRRYVDAKNQRAIVGAMFAFNVLLIASIAAFALVSNFYLALLALWSANVFRQADRPLYNTWIIRNSDPKMRATVMSMFGQVDAIGQIVGGPPVGWIGSVVSIRVALLTTSAILAPTILFFTNALQRSKHAPVVDATEEEEVPVATP